MIVFNAFKGHLYSTKKYHIVTMVYLKNSYAISLKLNGKCIKKFNEYTFSIIN